VDENICWETICLVKYIRYFTGVLSGYELYEPSWIIFVFNILADCMQSQDKWLQIFVHMIGGEAVMTGSVART